MILLNIKIIKYKEQILEGEFFTELKWEYLCPYVLVDYPEEDSSTVPFDALYQYIEDKIDGSIPEYSNDWT